MWLLWTAADDTPLADRSGLAKANFTSIWMEDSLQEDDGNDSDDSGPGFWRKSLDAADQVVSAPSSFRLQRGGTTCCVSPHVLLAKTPRAWVNPQALLCMTAYLACAAVY